MSQIVSLQPLAQAADLILAFSTLLSAAFVYQRSRSASKFVALGGGVAVVCVVLENFLMWAAPRFMSGSEATFYIMQLVFVVRHVVYFGGLALALHTIAKEQRA